MTSAKDYLSGQITNYPDCIASNFVKEQSVDMYNASNRPDFWCQGLAWMNPPKARYIIVAIAQQVASDLDAGALKTKMLSLTTSMTEQEYNDIMNWAEPLRSGPSNAIEHKLLYAAAKFLKTEIPDLIKAPANYFVQHEIMKGSRLKEAIKIVADFLRTQVTLGEWRGSYT